MKLPTKIKIMGFTYNVKYFKNIEDVNPHTTDEDLLCGIVMFSQRTIHIHDTGDDYTTRQYLFHEISHILVNIFHLDTSTVEEDADEKLKMQKAKYIEDFIDAMATGYNSFLCENKMLR
jgi:hypothetical protein